MAPNLLFYQLLLVALVLICLLVHVWWPDHPTLTPRTSLKPSNLDTNAPQRPNRSRGISTNRSVKRVSKESIRVPRRPGRSSSSSIACGAADQAGVGGTSTKRRDAAGFESYGVALGCFRSLGATLKLKKSSSCGKGTKTIGWCSLRLMAHRLIHGV
jgi:hypothetical protein